MTSTADLTVTAQNNASVAVRARRIWSSVFAAGLSVLFTVVNPVAGYAHGGEEEVLPGGEFVVDYSVPAVDGATATSAAGTGSPALAIVGIVALIGALAVIYVRHTRTNNPDKTE
jgi:hypothetical protein